ncbi:MAG: hypothetical protein HN353_08995 [Bdellovibrionales bacterium]|jgi:hypothetical protein|nr:hypothetical protein [Bdellovibrionales bacterium]MBT3526208.1 hypothetical protein [Bdellovibrionales bacterium]MBT7668442.1 hypothetical protein [Bdellovibrionales bacterium]MBT7767087.1 hypothetical protein [Bdellovibrionales bacterium]
MRYCIVSGTKSVSWSVTLLLALLTYQLDHQAVESIFLVEYMLLPVATVITYLIVGEMRSRALLRVSELRHELAKREKVVESVQQHRKILERENREIKNRITGQLETLGTLYHLSGNLNEYNFSGVMDCLVEILEVNLKVSSGAIYYLQDGLLKLQREVQISGGDTYFATVLDPDNSSDLIMQESSKNLKVASVNTGEFASSYNHSSIHGALLTGPLVNKSGELVGMVVINQMGFTSFNSSNIKFFKLMIRWISSAVARVDEINQLRQERFYDSRSMVINRSYYQNIIEQEVARANLHREKLFLLKIHFNFTLKETAKRRRIVKKVVSLVFKRVMRPFDSLAQSEIDDCWHCILPAVNEQQAEMVLRRTNMILKRLGVAGEQQSATVTLQLEDYLKHHDNEEPLVEKVS